MKFAVGIWSWYGKFKFQLSRQKSSSVTPTQSQKSETFTALRTYVEQMEAEFKGFLM